ncbi:response regulator [Luteimonas terrae]|uniref:Response regulator n=1 Tax=Luteimonas terrae TaxID=1530191 RepID=A0A4R5U8C9_9GAMM|nr:response regulator [Luteimonas terrae]TDK30720.1 response regulator [Luteimonas terrae]
MTDAAPLRVLIVDDSRDDAELTELALRDAGIPVEVRREYGESGLVDALREFQPQLLLSDVNIPGFSGAEAMHLTRAMRPGVPVVFLTGSAIGAPGEELPEGDALVFKDELELLPDVVRRLVGA